LPDIDTLLDSLEAKYESELNRVYAEMTRRLDDYVVSFDVVEGAFANTPANMQRLANSRQQIGQILRESGYTETVDNMLSEYEGIIEQVNRDYIARGISPAFDQIDTEALRLAASQDLAYMETIGDQGVQAVSRQLVNAVGGNGNAVDFINSIKDSVPAYYKRWASTYATTAQANFARSVEDKVQRAAGVTEFEYFGPLDKNTRPFCRDLLLKGGTHTREEIAKMDNGQTPVGTVKEMGGGWNCRHRWLGA
jgi:hypothetical protein